MQDVTKMADLAEAQNTAKILADRLHAANSQLSKYMISFDVEVNNKTFDVTLTAQKPFNGGGFIKTIPKDICLYYKNDVNSLVETICEEVFDVLLKPNMKKELTAHLARAITNIAIMDMKK